MAIRRDFPSGPPNGSSAAPRDLERALLVILLVIPLVLAAVFGPDLLAGDGSTPSPAPTPAPTRTPAPASAAIGTGIDLVPTPARTQPALATTPERTQPALGPTPARTQAGLVPTLTRTRPASAVQTPPPTVAPPPPVREPLAVPSPMFGVTPVAARDTRDSGATPGLQTATPSAGESLARPAPEESPRTYVVQPGDQLKQIAARFGVSIWEIAAANDLPDPDNLRVGQVLVIPGPK